MADETRFLLLADPQLGCYASFSGITPEEVPGFAARGLRVRPVPRVEGFEWDATQLRRAIDVANDLRPDFVVIAGDMVNDLASEEQRAAFMALVEDLHAGIPLHWLPGNHDATFDGEVPTQESLERYRSIFGAPHYAFEHGGSLFVAMNTVVMQRPDHVPQAWEAELAWLEETLRAARPGQAVLLGHHPLFVADADEPDTYWNIPRERRAPLLELIHRYGVRYAFAGHWHRNAIARDGDFEMVTSGPVGYPLGDDPSGYRVVEISDGDLKHTYYPLPEQ